MKKISIFAILLSLVVLCVGSCFILPGGNEAKGPSADKGNNEVVGNTVYDFSTTLYIVYNAPFVTEVEKEALPLPLTEPKQIIILPDSFFLDIKSKTCPIFLFTFCKGKYIIN